MRPTILAAAALLVTGCLSGARSDLDDPTVPFEVATGYGAVELMNGAFATQRMRPTVGGPAQVQVPYDRGIAVVGAEYETHGGDPSGLGTPVGLAFAGRFGWRFQDELDPGGMIEEPEVGGFGGLFDLSMTGSLSLWRKTGFLLLATTTMEWNVFQPSDPTGQGDIMGLSLGAGGRAFLEMGSLRTRLSYDLVPFFWAGRRLEHRLDASVAFGGEKRFGARAGYHLAQDRLDQGGVTHHIVLLGLEVQL